MYSLEIVEQQTSTKPKLMMIVNTLGGRGCKYIATHQPGPEGIGEHPPPIRVFGSAGNTPHMSPQTLELEYQGDIDLQQRCRGWLGSSHVPAWEGVTTAVSIVTDARINLSVGIIFAMMMSLKHSTGHFNTRAAHYVRSFPIGLPACYVREHR